jgi:hypothetical protein
MNWKTSLDKYLTNEPYDVFDTYCENIADHFSDNFFNQNEDWIMDFDGQCSKWINKLFNKAVTEENAVKIIERAFKIYKLNNHANHNI